MRPDSLLAIEGWVFLVKLKCPHYLEEGNFFWVPVLRGLSSYEGVCGPDVLRLLLGKGFPQAMLRVETKKNHPSSYPAAHTNHL